MAGSPAWRRPVASHRGPSTVLDQQKEIPMAATDETGNTDHAAATTSTFHVAVEQVRRKTFDVRAESSEQAESRVREKLNGDYCGWVYGRPRVEAHVLDV